MTPDEVKRILDKDDEGKTRSTIQNFVTILQNDDAFSAVRYNIMTDQPEKGKDQWRDTDDAKMLYHIENNYHLYSPGKLKSALLVFLDDRAYSPVRELIKSIHWDGIPRCEAFFLKWAKAPQNTPEEKKYSQECGRLFFAQGIARAFEPGSKCDHVVVLMGDQGRGKSTLTELLAMDRKYYSKLKSIKGSEAEKNIEGKWIIELEEMIATTSADTVEEVKQFISSQVDTFRNSYGKRSVDHLRTCQFIGTTNRYTFLTDPTGNRRWYPLKYDQEAEYLYMHKNECVEDIRQCWAEMYHYWEEHNDMASTAPNSDLIDIIEQHQRDAEADDPDIGIIEYWITRNKKSKVCVPEVWEYALNNKQWELKKNRQASVDIASKLTNRIGCKRGGTDRFGRFGQQKAFIVPSRLLTGQDAYQQAMAENEEKMPF